MINKYLIIGSIFALIKIVEIKLDKKNKNKKIWGYED